MTTQARVVVCPQQAGPLQVEEISIPEPEESQVVVKQFASGICHSQLHQIHNRGRAPFLLGHESTGVVIQTGSDVSHVQDGDTVLLTWVPRDASKNRRVPTSASLETSMGPAFSQNVFTWADHTIVDEQYVVKADPDIDRDVTSIIGCAVMTGAGAVLNTADVQAGQSVAIFGVGGVGLSAVAGAAARSAYPLIAVDLDEEKLEFAKQFGATHTVNAADVNPIEAIHNLVQIDDEYTIGGRKVTGVDFAFDCIGHRVTMEQIVAAVRPGHFGVRQGGTAVLVGVPQTTFELNAGAMLGTEKQFRGSIGGSCCPDRDFPTFLSWHESGTLDLNQLVTERYRLDEINEATTALEEGKIQGRSILTFDD